MSENFSYKELLKKGIELESCGMSDVAKDIYVTFVQENSICLMGEDRVDVLVLMYGSRVYEGITTWNEAVERAYMGLLGKCFLTQLYAAYQSKWRFSNASGSGKTNKNVSKFFEWLKTGVTKSFDLRANSECIINAEKGLKASSDFNVIVSSDIRCEGSFVRLMCQIASVNINSVKQ